MIKTGDFETIHKTEVLEKDEHTYCVRFYLWSNQDTVDFTARWDGCVEIGSKDDAGCIHVCDFDLFIKFQQDFLDAAKTHFDALGAVGWL